jgi:hypothetical protein
VNTVVTTPSADVEIKPLPPALSIAASANGLLVSWPASDTQFVLEALVNGTWTPVSGTPTLQQGEWSMAIDAAAPLGLFRLHQQ